MSITSSGDSSLSILIHQCDGRSRFTNPNHFDHVHISLAIRDAVAQREVGTAPVGGSASRAEAGEIDPIVMLTAEIAISRLTQTIFLPIGYALSK